MKASDVCASASVLSSASALVAAARVGEAGPRGRVRGVFRQCSLEVRGRCLQPFRRAPVREVSALKVEVVRIDAAGRTGDDGRGLRRESAAQGTDDRPRDVVLHLEHILRIPLVGLRPERETVGHVDELSRDAQARSGAPYTALDDTLYVQPRSDVVDVDALALECERRATSSDSQPLDFREGARQLVGHAVGEVLLLGVIADVCHGQHGDGGRRSGRRICRGQARLSPRPMTHVHGRGSGEQQDSHAGRGTKSVARESPRRRRRGRRRRCRAASSRRRGALELAQHVVGALRSVGRLLLEQAHDERREGRGKTRPAEADGGRRLDGVRGEQRLNRSAAEGRAARQQLVGDDA